MNDKGDTPRTDAQAFYWTDICTGKAPANAALVVDAGFARDLERELAQARAELVERAAYAEGLRVVLIEVRDVLRPNFPRTAQALDRVIDRWPEGEGRVR